MRGLDWSGAGKGIVVGFCENGNELLNCMKSEKVLPSRHLLASEELFFLNLIMFIISNFLWCDVISCME